MTLPQLLFILFTVMLLAAGQILFKLASNDIVLNPSELLSSLVSIKLFFALVIYAIATLCWLITLKGLPLRVAYPFVAMTFFIVPTLAHFLLGETLHWNTYLGAAIIAVGVVVSVIR